MSISVWTSAQSIDKNRVNAADTLFHLATEAKRIGATGAAIVLKRMARGIRDGNGASVASELEDIVFGTPSRGKPTDIDRLWWAAYDAVRGRRAEPEPPPVMPGKQW